VIRRHPLVPSFFIESSDPDTFKSETGSFQPYLLQIVKKTGSKYNQNNSDEKEQKEESFFIFKEFTHLFYQPTDPLQESAFDQ